MADPLPVWRHCRGRPVQGTPAERRPPFWSTGPVGTELPRWVAGDGSTCGDEDKVSFSLNGMPCKSSAVECLIVVDMQRAFVEGADASPQMPQVLPAVRQQISAARAAGSFVVQLQNDGAPGSVDEPGTPGWQLSLGATSSDLVIRKSEDSGFVGTGLHQCLQGRQIRVLSVCGVMSEMCVAATARDAVHLGYEVVLAHDSHGTYPVPPYSPGEPEVSAEHAARAAEWSLGDTITIPACAADIRFVEAAAASD